MDLVLLNLLGQDKFCTIPSSQQGVTAIQTLRNILNTLYGMSNGAIPRTLGNAGMDSERMDTYFKAVCQQEINVDPDKIKAILTHSLDGQPMAQG